MRGTSLPHPGLVGSAAGRLIHTSSFPLLTAMPDEKILPNLRGKKNAFYKLVSVFFDFEVVALEQADP